MAAPNGAFASNASNNLWGRFRTARAQHNHSANYYAVYPGNTPENHSSPEACMINSKQHGVQNSGPWDPWLPLVENSRLFVQRTHSALCAPYGGPSWRRADIRTVKFDLGDGHRRIYGQSRLVWRHQILTRHQKAIAMQANARQCLSSLRPFSSHRWRQLVEQSGWTQVTW